MNPMENAPKGNKLLFCGAMQWEAVDRKSADLSSTNLLSTTCMGPLMGINIRFVAVFHWMSMDGVTFGAAMKSTVGGETA